jgi:hypothetical protein
MDRQARLCLGALLALYFVVFGAAASHRAFWFDELFTAYLAGLPTATSLIDSLRAGADLAPPLFHLVTRACSTLPGGSQIVVRLPALIGFGVFCASLFIFVNRRCGLTCGIAAMLVPVATGFTQYAIEARPYGLVLGCFGVALVSWQAAAEGRRRPASLIGLAIAVAAGVSFHYYAILILVPVGLGEVVRLIRDRRLDAGVIAALGTGPLALLAHLPLFALSKPYTQNAWAAPNAQALVECLAALTGPVVLVCLIGGLGNRACSILKRSGVARIACPAHEWAAAIGFATLPFFVYGAGIIATGIFVPRYALGAMAGIAIALAFLLRSAPRLARFVVIALACGATLNAIGWFAPRVEAAGDQILRHAPANVPVVSGNAFHFLGMSYYNPSARVAYLADPAEARRRTGSDAPDLGLLALGRWAPIPVKDYAAFAGRRQPFVLYWRPDQFSWLLPKLNESNASVRVIAENSTAKLFLVEWR